VLLEYILTNTDPGRPDARTHWYQNPIITMTGRSPS
jgi:hypothetical protein